MGIFSFPTLPLPCFCDTTEQRAAAGDEQAEDLLAEVDTLLIEHAHEEAITEGIITRVGNAWIV